MTATYVAQRRQSCECLQQGQHLYIHDSQPKPQTDQASWQVPRRRRPGATGSTHFPCFFSSAMVPATLFCCVASAVALITVCTAAADREGFCRRAGCCGWLRRTGCGAMNACLLLLMRETPSAAAASPVLQAVRAAADIGGCAQGVIAGVDTRAVVGGPPREQPMRGPPRFMSSLPTRTAGEAQGLPPGIQRLYTFVTYMYCTGGIIHALSLLNLVL